MRTDEVLSGSGEPEPQLPGGRASVAERAVVALRQALFEGELQPGEQVNQYVWSERLHVSRAALREGLKILAASRLLEHDQNRGYFVANPSLSEMAELYWLRIVVEREVLLGCRRPSEAEAVQLLAEHDATVAAVTRRDPQESLAAERRFYFAIYDLSQRRLLLREARRFWDLAAVYRTASRTMAMSMNAGMEQFRDRKRRQLQAVLDGDRFTLAESVVNERRRMLELFQVEPFVPTDQWPGMATP